MSKKLGVVSMLVLLAGCSDSLAPARARAALAKASAERRIADSLKDPRSAEFSEEHVRFGQDTDFVCGKVNAKNSFGAYGGSKRFLADGNYSAIDDGGDDFAALWSKVCPAESGT